MLPKFFKKDISTFLKGSNHTIPVVSSGDKTGWPKITAAKSNIIPPTAKANVALYFL